MEAEKSGGHQFNRVFVLALFGCTCLIAVPALVLSGVAMSTVAMIDVCPGCPVATVVCSGVAVNGNGTLAAVEGVAAATHATTAAHFTYSGTTGPEFWGDMPGYEVCGTGVKQSPINIVTGAVVIAPASETAITRDSFQDVSKYYPNAYADKIMVKHTGHGVGTDEIDAFFTHNQIWYRLVQFHMHTPSEHSVNGFLFDGEIHFVHQRQTGEYLVVGVMITQGTSTPSYMRGIMDHLPEPPTEVAEHRRASAAPTLQDFNYTQFIEEVVGANVPFYSYSGSFTTPPCTEVVTWVVLKDPITMTAADILNLKNAGGVNNRPVKPLNERSVLFHA
mmetsp:Transcript_31553/g.73740  ORF Transcript_31553/g.73740 Transcript_31553/m.73740 type:complete len:333 (+) Transcript_31553:179-1177(+)